MLPRFVRNERVGFEHAFESLRCRSPLVSDFRKLFEVPRDLTFVPFVEDRFDIREVLVQSRSTDAGLLRDLRHRHGPEPMLPDERRGRLYRRVADRAAMLFDRVFPYFGHDSGVYLERDRPI
jgi:hypothetical protein